MYKYLIIHDSKPFYTNLYNYENNYVDGMIVIDLYAGDYTTDGVVWIEVQQDHL